MLEKAQPREFQMITLTLRHTAAPLDERLKFLRSSFRKLRHRGCWKKSVQFGYAVLEINWSQATGCWHPHLHILARCAFINWTHLRKDWIQITNGSHHVNSQIVHRPHGAANYLVKYLGKAPDDSVMSTPDRAAEYYHAIDRAKLILPFGKPPPPPKQDRSLYEPKEWEPIADLNKVIEDSLRNDHDAMKLLDDLSAALQPRERFFHHIDGSIHQFNSRSPPDVV